MNVPQFGKCCERLWVHFPELARYWKSQPPAVKRAAAALFSAIDPLDLQKAVDEVCSGKHRIEAYDRERLFVVLSGRCAEMVCERRAAKRRERNREQRHREMQQRTIWDDTESSWRLVCEIEERTESGENREQVLEDVAGRLGVGRLRIVG